METSLARSLGKARAKAAEKEKAKAKAKDERKAKAVVKADVAAKVEEPAVFRQKPMTTTTITTTTGMTKVIFGTKERMAIGTKLKTGCTKDGKMKKKKNGKTFGRQEAKEDGAHTIGRRKMTASLHGGSKKLPMILPTRIRNLQVVRRNLKQRITWVGQLPKD